MDEKPAMNELTPKQRRFVEAYVGPARGNACEAARIAGYRGSPQTLRAVGHENLTKPDIAAAVKKRTEMALESMRADEVLLHLTDIASGRDQRARVSDRIRALELLGKNHALWTDVQEVRDLPKDERKLDAMIEYHLKRVMGPERAEIVLNALRDPQSVH
jgi:phage terminase small subunit